MNSNIVIENPHIKKELQIKSGRINGCVVTNNLSGIQLSAGENSEEFIINFKVGFGSMTVSASQLKISDCHCCETDGGKEYRINFKSVKVRDSRIIISLVYTLNDFRCYMRKHLEFSFEKRGKKEIKLDYIKFEHLIIDEKSKYWSIPEQKDSIISGFALSLGQPVYVDSFYMGCEFPAAINNIIDYKANVKYYSGKSLHEIIGSDKYLSPKSVLGGAESDIYEQVQKSFYEYIKDISKPVYLRRQYNSWFDHMLNISEKNITESFLEVEKQFTATGEPPLDSYVMDDGWNDYSKSFWTFNGKFPNELYPMKKLSESFGSRFGLWLGPRGGYTSDTIKFARKIESGGNGYVNRKSLDICVGSEKYVNKTTDFLVDCEKRFDINYFKLDGFARKPCKNKHHGHLTGGYKNMYFYSDVWEKWIKAFEKLSLNSGSDFWINLTCYAWPSPWFLQWVNSMWLQISEDIGFIGKKGSVSDKDRMLSYRDEIYLDFYKVRQFQFPQRAIYNHEPIYGNEAKISMTDNEFRDYLFMMATRGTQFWELYYSYNMMNEAKWRINYSCMRFIEENIDVLSNSVIFGGRPSQAKVYGYSCFSDHEGIVSVRNSSDNEQSFTLRLDELIGVSKDFAFGELFTVLPYTVGGSQGAYSYGDTITLRLSPYESRILHFGKRKKELKAEYVKAVSDRIIEVQFNQTVDISSVICNENRIKNINLLEDYMTAVIEFEELFDKENELTLLSVKDVMNNEADIRLEFSYYEKNIVSDCVIRGSGDFTVEINITDDKAKHLFKQGDEIEIYIGDDGFVRFRVGVSTLKSSESCTDVVQITAVRERNGVLKLYFNKNLNAGMQSVYCNLKGEVPDTFIGVNVRLLNKALSYDEI